MRNFHLSVALLTFGAFGLTGLYMHFALDHLRELELAQRAFYRSRHIYILLAALIHGGLGAYVRPAVGLRWLQLVGSALITASTLALVVAFFVEPTAPNLRSLVSSLAIYSLTLGTLCHVFCGLRTRRPID